MKTSCYTEQDKKTLGKRNTILIHSVSSVTNKLLNNIYNILIELIRFSN